MSAGLVIAMLAVTAPPSASAHAATLFDVFRALCIDSAGDPQATMAKAKAMGWGAAEPSLVRALTKPSARQEKVTNVDGRGTSDLRGTAVVVVARTSRMIIGREIPAQACVVAAAPMDGDAVQAEAAAFAAVDHAAGLAFQKEARSYLWRQTSGGHEQIKVQDISATPAPGDVRMMVVMGGNKRDMGVLELFIPVQERN